MTAIKPKILQSGLQNIVSEDAIRVSLVEIGLGDSFLPVTGNETEMHSLREKYAVVDSRKDGPRRLHVTADAESPEEYPIHEIGFYGERTLRNGERERFLLAIAASEKPLAWKQKDNKLLIGFDIELSEIPPEKIEVTGPGERLNLSLASEFVTLSTLIMDIQAKYEQVLRECAALKAEVAELKEMRTHP